MAKSTKELAKTYYPRLWSIGRLLALVEAKRLTEADYNEITGFVYPATE